MKPVHVKPRIYIDFNKENNKEGPKFKLGDLNVEEIVGTFYKKEFQKTNQK